MKKKPAVKKPKVIPDRAFLSICHCGAVMFTGPRACVECRFPRRKGTRK